MAATNEAILLEAQKSPSKKLLPPAKGLSSSRWADSDEDESSTASPGPTATARLRGSPKKKQPDLEAEAVAEDFGKRLKLPSQSDLDTDRQKENHDDRVVAGTNIHGTGATTSKWAEERERNQKTRITKSNNLSWRAELDDDDLFSNKQSLRNSHGGDERGAHGGRRLDDRDDPKRRDGGWSGAGRNHHEGNRNLTSRRDNGDGWGSSRRDDSDRGRGVRRNADDSWIRSAHRDDNKNWGRSADDHNDNWGRRNGAGSSRRSEPVSSQPANRERLHNDFDRRRQADQAEKPVSTATPASATLKTDVKPTDDNSASTTDSTAGRSQALEKLMNTKIGHFDWADEDDF
ncbi:hypothetical protein D0Z00_003612 [Geotrichum galactomycetum]|uniref:Uncharacterized protein n=1 Tax=Geotrichum galactomycetum TaxID=27317 RepID=A0ACB6V0Q2_9ASCO|nr:hypothetical protein D0Z00_003612 [Geotrichum candidum]